MVSVVLRAGLLGLAARAASNTEPAHPGVCLLQRPNPTVGRQSRERAVLAEVRARVPGEADAAEDGVLADVIPEGAEEVLERSEDSEAARPASARLAEREIRAPEGRSGGGVRRRRRTGLPAHRSTAAEAAAAVRARKARESGEASHVTEIRGWPDADAPLVGLLQHGEHFMVKATRSTSAGDVWLELSDGRGFVRRGQAAKVPPHRRHGRRETGLVETRRRPGDPEEISEDVMANGFPKKVAPKHDVDHDAQHMKGTKMSVGGLPKESRYAGDEAYTADWRAEYPTAAPAPALAALTERNTANHALPAAAVMVALFAWVP